MSSLEDQIVQLEAAVVAQETMRSTLGDAVVDLTVAASQLAVFRLIYYAYWHILWGVIRLHVLS